MSSQMATTILVIALILLARTAMKCSMRRTVASWALASFLWLTVPLVAQEQTPVAPEGTQVATEETPAAAANADALRKAAQNPVASLISVPIQNNFNGGIDPGKSYAKCIEYPAGDSSEIERQLEPDHSRDHSHHLPAACLHRLPCLKSAFPAWATCSPLFCSLRENHTN